MKTQRIDSLEVPGIEPYLTMRRPWEHRVKGIFVAEGEKVVRRLVMSSLQIISVLLTEEWYEVYKPLLEERQIEDSVYVGERKFLEEIVGYRLHQGIMAIAKVPEPIDIFSLERKPGKNYLVVALDGIANSENMGVIVRNSAAFGVDALIVGESSCDPYLRRSVRNSMGTVFTLPVIYTDDLRRNLEVLKREHGIHILSANPREGSDDISAIDMSGDICFIFGSEGDGISRKVLDVSDVMFQVPMSNTVDSINVGSSVGVVLYEYSRRRH